MSRLATKKVTKRIDHNCVRAVNFPHIKWHGTSKGFWNEGKEKNRNSRGEGGLYKPLWNENCEGIGGLNLKELSMGEVSIFSGTISARLSISL